jgi:hypothetical protein
LPPGEVAAWPPAAEPCSRARIWKREGEREREREGRRLEAEVRRRVAAALESGEDWGLGAERDEDVLGG